MAPRFKYVFLIGLAISLLACYKAGTGGKAKLNIHVFNGQEIVPYSTIYIRYNADKYPGSNASYDDEKLGDHTGLAFFDKLKKGDYYIYATKYDTASMTTFEGGAYAAITNRKGEQHIVIDFGEEDPF